MEQWLHVRRAGPGPSRRRRADLFSFGAVLTRCSRACARLGARRGRAPSERDTEGRPKSGPERVSRFPRPRRSPAHRATDASRNAPVDAVHSRPRSGLRGGSRRYGHRRRSYTATRQFRCHPKGEPRQRQPWILLATLLAIALEDMAIYRSTSVPGPRSRRRDRIAGGAALRERRRRPRPRVPRRRRRDGSSTSCLGPPLKVMARSTSFRFRGEDVDPRQVGRDLQVDAC